MDRTKAEASDSGDSDRIVAEELERLLASPLFVRSPVLSRLLQFLVDHRLRGGRSAPKAYAIATEALGRSADFDPARSEEHTSELQSLMRISYAVFCLKKKTKQQITSDEIKKALYTQQTTTL